MRSWAEGLLALALVALIGWGLVLFNGDTAGSGSNDDGAGQPTDTTVAAVVDSESAGRGETLATSAGCVACHTTDGTTGTGPTWKGLYLSTRPLDDGSTVTADEVYLFRSITDPGSQIVSGFENVMPPTFADDLSDQDITDLVEYIKSLG